YMCPAGYPTIGYGHLVTEANKEQFLDGVDEDKALDLLRQDVAVAERAVLCLITVPLTDGQFDALVSFTFNLGAGALQRSTLRRKVNREEHDDVPAELMKWVWAGGRKLKGLVRRRAAEGAVYAS
ncbi:MAG: lysozyme, partial [Alphaproteobacteria bacterium]